jgi:type I restriction enzyme S subunit
LGDVIELISGQHLLAHEHNAERRGIPYLTGPSDFGESSPIPTRWTDQPKVLAQPGDILITVKGSGVGKTNVLVDQPTAISRQLMAIRVTGADPEFVNVVLKRAAEYFQNAKTGIAIPGIGRREVLGLPVVLPPLVEQKRIVAKVDELMALCDRLEAQQQERETRHAALARASLARFADAPIPANLNLLFHSSFPISPSDLRKSILTLAVQGKLVPQDPKDETAEEQLNNINRERLAAVKVRRISPMEPLPPVEEGEIAYDLRPGRALARLIELVMEIQTGPFGSSLHQRDYQVGGTPVINPASLKDGKIVPIESMAIGPDTLNRLEVFRLNEGDIVMARRGEMGRCAIVTKAEHGWLCGTGSLVLRMPTGMYAPFLALLIGAPEAREYLGGASVGTTMQNLNQGILAKMPVGVPPLAEQRRIVAKVSELMALVDELETQLAASRAAGEKLLTALVAELTGANS